MSDPTSSQTQAATPDQVRRSATLSTLGPHAPSVGERYRIESILAKGGMGEVYKAHDLALNRDVAIKVLLGEPANFELATRRFLHEASIGAQLQHPNIPPVYDIGSYSDGRPFLAMKLVKGRTLNELLKERADLAAERGRFVAIFEAIAQAIGYAHSRGVIHRDLKPSNVMVGAFGEVQVMDWGLAKFQSDTTELTPQESVASTFHDPRAGDDSRTSAGSIIGTPAYMPSEQAIGAVDKVTERSDVFGLGALLCSILTGQPPYVAADPEATRQLAAQGKLADAFARLDASGAEPELVALAKRCLNPDAAERPANGSEVAAAVARFRAEAEARARQAEVARNVSDARRRVLAWSAAVVVIVLGAGIAGTYLGWRRALATAERLEKLTTGLKDASQVALTEGDAEARRVAAAELQALLEVDPADASDPAQRRLRCAAEFQRGELLIRDNPNAALAAYENAAEIARRLIRDVPNDVAIRRDLISALYGCAKALIDLRRPRDAEMVLKDAERWANENYERFPNDIDVQRHRYIIAHQMGEALLLQGNLKAAKTQYEDGLKLTETIAKNNPQITGFLHDLSVSYNRVASVLREEGRYPEAHEQNSKALKLRELILDREPQNTKYQEDLLSGYRDQVDILSRARNYDEARAVIGKAIALNEKTMTLEKASASELSLYSLWFERLGLIAAAEKSGADIARTNIEKALEIMRRASRLDPNSTVLLRNIGVMYNHLGNLFRNANDPERAFLYYKQSLPVAQSIIKLSPNDLLYVKDLGLIHYFLADTQLLLNNVAEARRQYRASIVQLEIVARRSPDSLDAQSEYFEILHSAGKLEFLNGIDVDAAVAAFEAALKAVTPYERMIAQSKTQTAKNIEECRAMLQEAKAFQKLLNDLPSLLSQPQEKIPALLTMRGIAYAKRGDASTATATAERLVALRPETAGNYYDAACILGLVSLQTRTEPPARAMEWLKRAVELGFRDRSKLLTDEDLTAFRDRADFKLLVDSLDRAREPAPPPRVR